MDLRNEENITVFEHPLIQHKISLLRDKKTGTNEFRKLVEEIAMLEGFEAMGDLELEDIEVETPIETCMTPMIAGRKLAIVPILRAGLGMVSGILALVPTAKVGHIGMYRDEETHEPHEYYCKLPDPIEERLIVVTDPMLATGGSAVDAIDQIKKHKRKMNIVSRGGSLVFAWMTMTGEENPFYEYFDEILDICQEYDVTISLGDACRPGCLADGSDVCQIEELVRLGELTKRAWEKNVQVMVEGPGHMPMDQIAANMKLQSTICSGAPFYVLGPIVTDIAPGYDHIVSAIGGAIAAQNGAAFLCYVTPAEHLALPNLEDVKQGIMASKIAAHAADIAKGVRGAREIDDKMADARRVLDWEAQWECAMDPETAKAIRDDRKPEHEDTCSMCGKFCAVRSMNKALAGEHIDIL